MIKTANFNEDIKFFKRFLKEHGVYSRYKRYIRDKKTFNEYQRQNVNGWTFEEAVKDIGDIRLMITRLISWSRTKEGFSYWEKLHKKLRREYNRHFEDGED